MFVVFVDARDAEHADDGISDELLDCAFVSLDCRAHRGEVAAQDRRQLLGVNAVREPSRIGEIAKDDKAIRDRVLTELDKQPWAPRALINVVVKDAVVELWGTIFDERQREALIVAAENIPDVKSVHDNLVWVDPSSGMAVYAPDQETARIKVVGR